MKINRVGPVALLLAALGAGAAVAESTDFSQIARSRFVHCAFYKSYEKDPETGEIGRAHV